jgi:hypothetical protein
VWQQMLGLTVILVRLLWRTKNCVEKGGFATASGTKKAIQKKDVICMQHVMIMMVSDTTMDLSLRRIPKRIKN